MIQKDSSGNRKIVSAFRPPPSPNVPHKPAQPNVWQMVAELGSEHYPLQVSRPPPKSPSWNSDLFIYQYACLNNDYRLLLQAAMNLPGFYNVNGLTGGRCYNYLVRNSFGFIKS